MAQTLIIDIHLDPRLERLGTFIPLQYPERKKTERPQPQLSLLAEQFLQSPLLLLVLDIQVNNHLSLLSHLHKQIMNRLIMYLMKVILVLLVELKPLL